MTSSTPRPAIGGLELVEARDRVFRRCSSWGAPSVVGCVTGASRCRSAAAWRECFRAGAQPRDYAAASVRLEQGFSEDAGGGRSVGHGDVLGGDTRPRFLLASPASTPQATSRGPRF